MSNKLPTQYQEYIHLSRYARWLPDKRRRETWEETVTRYFDFFQHHLEENHQYKVNPELRRELEEAVLGLEVLPSMRCLMTAGKALEKESIAGYNCSYIAVDDPRAFDEALYILMNGTGLGFSVERQYISKLPEVPENLHDTDTTIVVADSKLGWAKGLKELISLLYSGLVPKWDLTRLRPAGAPLKTFGGRASGPGPLDSLLNFTVATFKVARGRRLTSLECHDIMCKIGEVVVVGGTRRSAMISLSNLSDDRMRAAKSGQWWERNSQRALANNSAVYTEKPDTGIFMAEWLSLYESKSGERGIFNRQASKKKVATIGRRDYNHEFGTNPCSEIILRNNQFCNLSEIVVRETDTYETLAHKARLATILGTWQSTLTNFKYLRKRWKDNTEEERLLGVSMTGIFDNAIMNTRSKDFDALGFKGFNSLEQILSTLKDVCIATNLDVSTELGIPQSTAITCVKPSGCQTPNSLIVTDKGLLSLAEIGNIDGDTWQNHEIKVSDGKTFKDSTKFYVNGISKTLKLTMTSGAILEATPNHMYKVWANKELVWKQAKDITTEDIIPYTLNTYPDIKEYQALKTTKPPYHNVRNINQPSILTEDLAWLLGLYYGDGSNHAKGIRIASNINEIHTLTKAKEIVQKLFGLTALIYERTKGVNNADLYVNSTYLLAWLKANKLEKQKSQTISIPRLIRQSPRAVVEAFIDGYFEADGALGERGRVFTTISRVMAEQLCTLLRSLGRRSSIYTMKPTESSYGTNDRYMVWELKGWSGQWKRDSKNRRIFTELYETNNTHLIPDKVSKIEESISDTYDIEVPENNQYTSMAYISHNTVSQLVNSASGIHARHSPYYIRTVRADKKDPLAQLMIDKGFPVEDDVMNPNSVYVFSFPVKSSPTAIYRDSISAIEHLSIWLTYQRHWCEHKPSVTITVKEDEWFEVAAWVYRYFDEMSGVSFLPHSDHVYKQAPYQDCDKDTYEQLLAKMPKNINWLELAKYESKDHTTGSQELACTAGGCEI